MADAGSEHAGPARGSTTWRVQSVDRAARLLRAIADAPGDEAATTWLADTCTVNRATAWRLLTTLEAHGLVARDADTGLWSMGPAVAVLAGLSGEDVLRRHARPYLARLCRAAGETAALALLGPSALTYVDEVAPDAIVAATWRGRTVPLHATSTGKAVLAARSGPDLVDLPEPLERFTDTTLTSRGGLAKELAAARRTGYTVCRGEYERSAWGVSSVVDVPGQPVAVVSLWGPASRIGEDRFPQLGTLVVHAARDLARELTVEARRV